MIERVEDLKRIIMDEATQFDAINWGGRGTVEQERSREARLRAYREAAQINHELTEMLRNAGLVAEASHYHLAELKYRRSILFTTPHYGAWLFSCMLNLISGHGERVGRTLATYLTVILGFALVYFVGTNYLNLETVHLSFYQAVIQSVVSFHGRGFVASVLQLGDPMAGVTVAESVCGLFIEAIFIATFSRRFFGG
jgi:hypothetical protein